MPACIIKSCQRTSRGKRTDKPRFHVFPPVKNPKFPLWLSAIGMTASEFAFVPSWRRYICSNHFTDDSYKWHLLAIPIGNRKLREDAVPSMVDKDTKPGTLKSDESSSESEYETEFESESEYESEYESLSTSEFASDIDEKVTVTKPAQTAHIVADIFGTRAPVVALLRKDNSQKQVPTASVDTSKLNRTAFRCSHGTGSLCEFRDTATQSDGKLCWSPLRKQFRSLSPEPNPYVDCNQPFKFLQDSIWDIKQDHRYSMQAKETHFRSRISQKDMQTSPVGEECQKSQVLAAHCCSSDESSRFSIPPSPSTASDKDSTYEPGSDFESIESLDIESNESISSMFNDQGYTQPNESVVVLSDSGEFLDSSIVVEEPISDDFGDYGNMSDSQDGNDTFSKNVGIYGESRDSLCVNLPRNGSILSKPVGSLEQERHQASLSENNSFVIKSEFVEMDAGNSEISGFVEAVPFDAGNFVHVKMECDETNIYGADSSESVGKDEPSVPAEDGGRSEICIKSEPVDPVDYGERNAPLNENKYVVYESCLQELLRRCIQCGATVPNPSFNNRQSMLMVTMICTEGHRTLWKSQPGIPFQFTDAFG